MVVGVVLYLFDSYNALLRAAASVHIAFELISLVVQLFANSRRHTTLQCIIIDVYCIGYRLFFSFISDSTNASVSSTCRFTLATSFSTLLLSCSSRSIASHPSMSC